MIGVCSYWSVVIDNKAPANCVKYRNFQATGGRISSDIVAFESTSSISFLGSFSINFILFSIVQQQAKDMISIPVVCGVTCIGVNGDNVFKTQ